MNYRRDDIEHLENAKRDRVAAHEAAIKAERDATNKAILERQAIAEAAEQRIDNFYKYKDDVKTKLVTEALLNIFVGSFEYSATASDRALAESFLGQYISEAGTANLLKRMKFSENSLLRTISESVNKYHKIITEEATADDPDSLIINPDNIDDFWKEIDDTEDIEDVTNTIRLRVANAEEDFLTRNMQDKENINNILKDTADRVEEAKKSYEDNVAEKIEESETRIAKDKIYQIQHESHRNVFDKMVRNLSESIMKSSDEELKKQYMTENSRLNVEAVVDTVRCMYTMLEMVSTIQLENVDAKYIKDTLDSIKA